MRYYYTSLLFFLLVLSSIVPIHAQKLSTIHIRLADRADTLNLEEDLNSFYQQKGIDFTISTFLPLTFEEVLSRRISEELRSEKLKGTNSKFASNNSNYSDDLFLKAQEALQNLANTVRISVSVSTDYPFSPQVLSTKLSRLDYVLYSEVEPEHILLTGIYEPNDEFLDEQTYLDPVMAKEAWSVVKEYMLNIEPDSLKKILLAVIDTGFDLAHEDFGANIFGNPGENGYDINGMPRSMNGLDDDGNGYIDDWRGWDFNPANSAEGGDSDPSGGHEHGMHVAGVSGAIQDNHIGIAGLAYHTNILPVKIGVDDPGNRAIANVYEALLYAAATGADIINCSWGSTTSTQTGRDAVIVATAAGSLIVAAAGNNNRDQRFYPASYPEVLSVGAVDIKGRKPGFSNYNHTIDIAAPGVSVYSTIPGDEYKRMSGTSMSTPIVSGIAALVMLTNPDMDNILTRELLVGNALEHTDSLWKPYTDKLGMGVTNALASVNKENTQLLTIDDIKIAREDTHPLRYGDTVNLSFKAYSHFDPIPDIDFAVYGEWGIASSPPFYQGDIGSRVGIQNNDGLWVTIEEDSYDYVSDLVVAAYSGGKKIAYESIEITVNPTYETYGNDIISMSSNSQGNIGFNNYPLNTQGIGLVREDKNYLFESGIILALSDEKLVNNLRGDFASAKDKDFSIESLISSDTLTDGTIIAKSVFRDRYLPSMTGSPSMPADSFAIGIEIVQTNIIPPGESPFVFAIYDIFNPKEYVATDLASRVLDPLYFGAYYDWDISATSQEDIAYFDLTDNSLIVADASALDEGEDIARHDSDQAIVWLMSGQKPGCFTIDNNGGGEYNPGIYDGFLRREKYEMISSGLSRLGSNKTDVSAIYSAGPLFLAPGDSVRLVFAIALLASTESRAQIKEQIDDYSRINSGLLYGQDDISSNINIEIYPNPYQTGSHVLLEMPRSNDVDVAIYDTSGRLVEVVAENRFYSKGKHLLPLPDLANGVYVVSVVSETDKESEILIVD